MAEDLFDRAAHFFFLAGRTEYELAPRFQELLVGHDLRVPVDCFEEWSAHLANIVRANGESDEAAHPENVSTIQKRLLDPIVDALIVLARTQRLTTWGRVVGLITVEALTRGPSAPSWPDSFWKYYAPDALKGLQNGGKSLENGVSPILEALDELYAGTAQRPVGGPLQFYCLCQACKWLPPTIDRAERAKLGSYHLDEYFNALELALHPAKRVRTYHILGIDSNQKEDWCFRYLAQRLSRVDKPVRTIRAAAFHAEDRPWYQPWMKLILRGETAGRKLTIAGPPNSGKRTMLDTFHLAISNAVQLGPALQMRKKQPDDAILKPVGQSDIGINLMDLPLGASSQPDSSPNPAVGVAQIAASSTIVLTVPSEAFVHADGTYPEEVLSVEGKAMIDGLQGLIQNLGLGLPGKQQYSFAIAYTKADEFGVASDHTRMMESPEDWKAFIDLAESIGSSTGEHDQAWDRFVTELTDRQNAAQDLIILRRALLNGTRLLWQAVAQNFKTGRAVINGYIVQAKPVLRDHQWSTAGCLQILADVLYEAP